MNILVSNTSPIRYLTYIGEQEILHRLFTKILIPKAVFRELTHKNTPKTVRKFIQSHPEWIEIHDVTEKTDSSLNHLDSGEKEAILLAEKVNADFLLISTRTKVFRYSKTCEVLETSQV